MACCAAAGAVAAGGRRSAHASAPRRAVAVPLPHLTRPGTNGDAALQIPTASAAWTNVRRYLGRYFVRRALAALVLDGAVARLRLGRQLATALGSRDQLVGRLLLGDEARLHAEVDGLRVVGHDRNRRLLGRDREPVGERHADLLEAEQAPDLL